MVTLLASTVCLIILTHGSAVAENRAPDLLSFSLGIFDVYELDQDNSSAAVEGRIEMRFGGKILGVGETWRGIGPIVGLMINSDGAVMPYGGLYADLTLGHFTIQPCVAIASYTEVNSKIRSGVFFEFATSLLLAYRFDDHSLLGLTMAHISDAGINAKSPGAESILLTYALPLGRIF